MKTFALPLLLGLAAVVSSSSAETVNGIRVDGADPGEWTHDWDAATAAAKRRNMPVFVNFTGSDWCSWCMLLKRQVFSQPEWGEWASNHVFLVHLDFPRDTDLVPEKYRERNRELSQRYNVRGYPTCYLLDPATLDPIGRFGASNNANAPDFIARVAAAIPDTMCPVDETPTPVDLRAALAFQSDDPGLKPLEKFAETILSVLDERRADADKAEQTLRGQFIAALNKAKNDAQKKGDLDAVLLFMELIKDPDAVPETDNQDVAHLLAQRETQKGKIAEQLKTANAKVLSTANTRLESMKRNETKNGNIALAKAIGDYQETVQSLLTAIAPTPPSAQPAEKPSAKDAEPSSTASFGPGVTSALHVMSVDKETGTGLGRFEVGEVMVIQYVSGKYKYRYSSSYAPTSPDSDEHSNLTSYYAPSRRPFIEGPLQTKSMQTWDIPLGTAAKPFAIPIKDAGFYNFKTFAGSSWEGRLTYRVTKLSVIQARQLLQSKEKDKYQWQ